MHRSTSNRTKTLLAKGIATRSKNATPGRTRKQCLLLETINSINMFVFEARNHLVGPWLASRTALRIPASICCTDLKQWQNKWIIKSTWCSNENWNFNFWINVCKFASQIFSKPKTLPVRPSPNQKTIHAFVELVHGWWCPDNRRSKAFQSVMYGQEPHKYGL